MGTFSMTFRALLAALTVAGLPPAPELCMILTNGVVQVVVGIKVIVQRPIGEVPTITVLFLGIDVKYLIILLELVHQGRHRLEGQREGSPHSCDHHSHCWRNSLNRYMPPPLPRANVLMTEKCRGSLHCIAQMELYCHQAHFIKHETGICIISYLFREKSFPWKPLVLEVVVSRIKRLS